MSESISSIHVSAGMRRLLASEATSNFGSMLSRLAIPWIAALVLDATPLQMAWLVIADVVAGAVGSLFAGSLVDRTNKKNLMIGSDVIRAAVIGALAVLLFMESLAFWIVVLQSAANGVLAMVFSIARSAWLAEHVPHGELTVRNSQMSAASSTSESVAFASGGWIYQWLGPMVALVSDVASYLISALCLRGLPEKPQPIGISRTAKRNWMKDVFAGFRLVAAKPVLRCLAVCDVFLALGFSITGASYLIFVSRDLAFETGPLGLIFATGALGSLAGAAMASRLGRAMGSGNAVAIGLLGAGLGALLIPLAPTAGLVGALGIVQRE